MPKQIPVWPYFFLALLSGAVGITLLYYNLGPDFPAENSLEKISGRVDRVFLIDDLSGKPTTIIKPINSIHFTLEDNEGVFRYPGNWPGYSKLWHQLSFHVDIWVPRSDIENKNPRVVYRIEQQVPDNWVVEPFSFSYQQIAASQGRSGQSYVQVGWVLTAASAGFVVVALMVRTWNRRRRESHGR